MTTGDIFRRMKADFDRVLFADDPPADVRICRGCGCTDDRACPGGCHWVLLDLDAPTGVCSTCAEAVEWDPQLLMMLGADGASIEQLYAGPL